MYLPNIHYIPAPFNQSLSGADTNAAEENIACEKAKPDIIAAESSKSSSAKNDNMDTAMLIFLLMELIN